MTDSPVLSKKQRKKALLSRKGPKETVKTTLANPYSTFFPVVNETDAETLKTLLRNLPRLKSEKRAVPWNVIKDVPREERKKLRESYTEKVSIDQGFRTNFVFGVNDVTKLLEKNEASSVLVSGDVNPRFMVKHVVDLAVLRDTPVVIVPGLRETLKTTTGIPSVSIAIGMSVPQELKQLLDTVKTISARYPVPKKHIHHKTEPTPDTSIGETLRILEPEEPMDEDIYLYRTSTDCRMFVPPPSRVIETKEETFLALCESPGIKKVVDRTTNYKGLKVKKIRNNKNRMKKKKKVNK